jgi:hypothetical protein
LRVVGKAGFEPFLIRQAFRLEWLTVAWMVIEALVAIGSGVIAGSLTLTAFGLDSVIELISAGVLIWRLSEELRRGQEFSTHAERIASRSGGALLSALAVYIVLDAAWSLWTHHGGEFSVTGLIVAAVAMPIMSTFGAPCSILAITRSRTEGAFGNSFLKTTDFRVSKRPA